MIPIAAPGAMTERERFMFDTFGYLVIPDALSIRGINTTVAKPIIKFFRYFPTF